MVISRRERKKIAARAQILSAAIDLFSRRGLDAVTMDEIAAAADVGKGTIYNYFATKEDIVVAFMADLEARLAPIHDALCREVEGLLTAAERETLLGLLQRFRDGVRERLALDGEALK